MTPVPTLPFDNSYSELPAQFYTAQIPTPVSEPGLVRINREVAQLLDIDPEWLESKAGIEILAGNQLPQGANPIAQVYAGHQFGGWNPQLGDGRAVLLGELVGRDGLRYDLALKGSGPTAYSRGGDGRAPLGPVLREYIVSEAMAALNIPTTRALAAVSSGDTVMREQALPGGVLTRVAQSHIRFGTFQFFWAQQDTKALHLLLDHVICRHYPEAAQADQPGLATLEMVVAKQARLIAQWQAAGFIHGVMNTDNMLLSGETIDYGPCAFMDHFNVDTVFSSIDRQGRYAYRNQPSIAHWNLAALAQALLPVISSDSNKSVEQAQEVINTFPDLFREAHLKCMSAKLGIAAPSAEDEVLLSDLLELMSREQVDFTLTFRRLSELACAQETTPSEISGVYRLPQCFDPWLARWRARLALEPMATGECQALMYSVNPVYIPRNHLVEEAIKATITDRDYAPFHQLVETLASPFTYNPQRERYAAPPKPEQVVNETFCGT